MLPVRSDEVNASVLVIFFATCPGNAGTGGLLVGELGPSDERLYLSRNAPVEIRFTILQILLLLPPYPGLVGLRVVADAGVGKEVLKQDSLGGNSGCIATRAV